MVYLLKMVIFHGKLLVITKGYYFGDAARPLEYLLYQSKVTKNMGYDHKNWDEPQHIPGPMLPSQVPTHGSSSGSQPPPRQSPPATYSPPSLSFGAVSEQGSFCGAQHCGSWPKSKRHKKLKCKDVATKKWKTQWKPNVFFLKVQFLDFLVSESYIHHQHPWISFQHNYLLALSGVQGLVLSRSIPPYAPRMHTRTHTYIYNTLR